MTSASTDDLQRRGGACAGAFATAVKNLTIYPVTHPRVVAAVEAFVSGWAELGAGPAELCFARDATRIGDTPVETTGPAVGWLLERTRAAGLRGVQLAADVTADDVVAFGQALLACRPGSGASLDERWPADERSVRPLALVIGDNHAPGGRVVTDGADAVSRDDAPTMHDGLAARLAEVGRRPEVQRLLDQLGSLAPAHDDGETASVDVLGRIGELLPADQPTDLESLTGAVTRVLEAVHAGAARADEQPDRRNAALLDGAVEVARKFFGRDAVDQHETQDLPTGRPGDERYTADLDALLAEYEALPSADFVRLPPSTRFAPDSPHMAVELAGVQLHRMATGDAGSEAGAPARLRELLARHPTKVAPLVTAHLAARDETTPQVRLKLLELLLATDDGPARIRAGGHLSDDLLLQGFPDVLPIASAVLTTDEDLARMRFVLTGLRAMLASGGIELAQRGGHLRDPGVVTLLARTGGDEARALLAHVDVEAPAVRTALLEVLSDRALPRPEATALQVLPNDQAPGAWLVGLLAPREVGGGKAAVRLRTGQLLRAHAERAVEAGTRAECAAAIAALAVVADPDTKALLQRLARRQWWHPGARQRAIRAAARRALRSPQEDR